MQKLLLTIDRISTFIGQAFSWLIVALTVMITWEVFSRYVLDHPHAWAFDVMIIMYGTLFMMAGAYTLSKNGHVRGDVLYGFFEPRTQATIDLILFILFFIPTFGGLFLEHDNFTEANALVTPEHIKPVWYFTPYYAMLRAVPDKLLGVMTMGGAVMILFLLPWLDRSPVKSIRYRSMIAS